MRAPPHMPLFSRIQDEKEEALLKVLLQREGQGLNKVRLLHRNEWKEAHKNWKGEDLSEEIEKEASYHMFLQYEFLCQWKKVKEYANKNGIRIMGDVPFYVGIDSVDVWAGKENFLLGADGQPSFIAGVPPDYFSAVGQRWGNPVYDWDYLKKTGYDFWVKRIGYNSQLFDLIRIDHFRAFDTFWKIPASCPTAVEGECPSHIFPLYLWKTQEFSFPLIHSGLLR